MKKVTEKARKKVKLSEVEKEAAVNAANASKKEAQL